MRRIVIVGGGLAGLRAGQEIRGSGFDGELTIVGEENHLPYNRPPLSKQFLAAEMEPHECELSLGSLEANWILGDPAAHLDSDSRMIQLVGGDTLPYDGLVIATGRRARAWPNLPDLSGFHMLRGLDDAIALREAVAHCPRVVIVGAGFVGCEVAATLRRQGLEVHLIDIAPHPMPTLGPEFGRRATRLHAGNGVRLHLDSSVDGFEGRDHIEAVHLADGTRLPADLVLIALGSKPNTEWLQDSGLALQQGSVLCDSQCFSLNYRDIVAAGDVATWAHPGVDDEPVHVEHWANASDMARRAARNLLDPAGAEAYAPVPTFWSDQYDAKIKAVGLWSRVQQVTVVEEDTENNRLVAEGRYDGDTVSALIVNKNKSYIDYRRRLTECYGPKTVTSAST